MYSTYNSKITSWSICTLYIYNYKHTIFEKTVSTKEIHYYDVPLPEGYRSFSKTKPFRSIHLDCVRNWWDNRDKEDLNSYKVTIDEVIDKEYNLDFKNPNQLVEEREYTLEELLDTMEERS